MYCITIRKQLRQYDHKGNHAAHVHVLISLNTFLCPITILLNLFYLVFDINPTTWYVQKHYHNVWMSILTRKHQSCGTILQYNDSRSSNVIQQYNYTVRTLYMYILLPQHTCTIHTRILLNNRSLYISIAKYRIDFINLWLY